jgi:hypothetical protein
MHELMLFEVVKHCQEREAAGDGPSYPAYSAEQLERAVLQLAAQVNDYRAKLLDEQTHLLADEERRKLTGDALSAEASLSDLTTPRRLDDWHEDHGPALWWKFPLCEAPYSGSPLDTDWPGYHTHWTPLPEPAVWTCQNHDWTGPQEESCPGCAAGAREAYRG